MCNYGFAAHSGGERIPVLQYADDTVLFLQEGIETSNVLLRVLGWFEVISGLHVNCFKSKVFFINEPRDRAEILSLWGCEQGSFPDVYLGIPFGACYRNIKVWDSLIDRFRERLAHWKRRYLSKGGRIVLLKSTLASLPVHMMSVLVMPKKVVKEIEGIMRGFLWGSTKTKKKFHLISWDEVCLPKNRGGLGLKRIEEVNKALLVKWLWEFGKDENKLWKRVVEGRHGREVGGWLTKEPRGRYGMGLWKGIWTNISIYHDLTRYKVGNGRRIKFWTDKWLGEETLKVRFQILFDLTRRPDATVKDCAVCEANQVAWNLEFRRRLTDTEIRECAELLQQLESISLNGEDDERGWTCISKDYSVKLCSDTLVDIRRQQLQIGSMEFPTIQVWRRQIPQKVCFFLWCVMRERVLTHKMLQRRGVQLASKCVMCGREEEDARHLFLECSFVQELWTYFYGCLCTVWIENASLVDVLRREGDDQLSRVGNLYWNCLVHAVMWSVWEERNQRIFENNKQGAWRVANRVKYHMWNWNKNTDIAKGIVVEELMFEFARLVRAGI